MGGVEDSKWVDLIIDEIGSALIKADETIQKSIEFWKELTKDLFDDHPIPIPIPNPTKELTGQPKHSSVKERPIQHWALRVPELNEEPIQHWALRASKIPGTNLIQEQGDEDYYDNDDDDDDDSDYDDDSDDSDDDGDDDHSDDGDEDKDEYATRVSENMWELSLGTSETTYSPSSWYDHHNEEDCCSSLRWEGGYELLKNDDSFSEENGQTWSDIEVDTEAGEQVMEMFPKNKMVHVSKEPLKGHVDEDNKLQGFVNVSQEEEDFDEVDKLFQECDWVYVTTD